MVGIQGKKKKKRYLWGFPVAVVLILVFFVFARATWKMYQQDALSRENLRLAQDQLAVLRDRQSDLEEKLKRLETSRGIEEEIRVNFSVVKEGEKVINLVEEATSTVPTTTAKKSWWQIF